MSAAADVQSLRARLWAAGFRPLAVVNPDAPGTSPGKRPIGERWQERARQTPPAVLDEPIRAGALNTGLLCDGLRAIDVDVDDLVIANQVRALAIDTLGDAPIRIRKGSPRCLLVYRAADGEPGKRTISGTFGKIEVLGRGQQFVGFGRHPSGGDLFWVPEPPGDISVDALTAITEADIDRFLDSATEIIGAKPHPNGRANGHDDAEGAWKPDPRGDAKAAEVLDVVGALCVIPNDGPADWEAWNKIGMATWAATGGSHAGFAAWCAWSERNPAHDAAACNERWRHYFTSPPTETGAGALFHFAHDAMPGWKKTSEQPRTKPVPIVLFNPVELEALGVPERVWIVQDWLPIGVATANYGDGGTGKTLLGQQLMTSCATGTPWCGLAVMRCRSLGVFCEDDLAELHRRQAKINEHLGISFADLGDMRWLSRVGQDNSFVVFTQDGRMHVTPLFDETVREAREFGARLVQLDTAADLFSGNENDRHQVRQFIGLLIRFAIEISGAVLLNAHPSREGLRTGNLDSGSTGWNNAVRSRWSLARPHDDDGNETDPHERVLTRRKANYSSIGEALRLRWVNGVLIPVTEQGGVIGAIHRRNAEEVFLVLLDRCTAAGQHVSDSRNSGNFAPKMFGKRGDREGYTARELEAAMIRLFVAKRIVLKTYTRNRHQHECIARVSDAKAGSPRPRPDDRCPNCSGQHWWSDIEDETAGWFCRACNPPVLPDERLFTISTR